MRKRIFFILPMLMTIMTGAHAGWEYPGDNVGDGWYEDDGARFVVSFRGGASYGFASIKNTIGTLYMGYNDTEDGGLETCVDENCQYYADLKELPATKDFSGFSFAGGASIGFTMPYRPQWRLELSWDHITETDYNQSPMYSGRLTLQPTGDIIEDYIGAVQSTVSSDVFAVMAYYDFYDGLYKMPGKFIPYVGFGAGYAQSKTVLNLSDLLYALSVDGDMQNFGTPGESGQLNFYRTETETGNFAAVLAAGVSYGITEYIYLDLGARVMYVPKIRWQLKNEDDTRRRDVFQARNMIYTNLMLGLRFEF